VVTTPVLEEKHESTEGAASITHEADKAPVADPSATGTADPDAAVADENKVQDQADLPMATGDMGQRYN
jgi:hypothetical protein